MDEQICKELYERMNTEQEAYRAELLAMPPDKILEHTWEYTAREDILDAVCNGVLPENQVRALLKSSRPLADVLKEYRDLDSPNDDILAAVEIAANLYMEPPIYRQDYKYAIEHSEKEAFLASHEAYGNCTEAIDNAIDRDFDGLYLRKSCVMKVLETYSPERIADVLASTVQQRAWDGRFSQDNRLWANGIDTSHIRSSPYRCICESHPAVLDGFISMFRHAILEQKRDEKATAPAQHKPQERSDDFEL